MMMMMNDMMVMVILSSSVMMVTIFVIIYKYVKRIKLSLSAMVHCWLQLEIITNCPNCHVIAFVCK